MDKSTGCEAISPEGCEKITIFYYDETLDRNYKSSQHFPPNQLSHDNRRKDF